jgi:hypothetical protein
MFVQVSVLAIGLVKYTERSFGKTHDFTLAHYVIDNSYYVFCRMKVVAVVSFVCVGASIATLIVAVVPMIRSTHTAQVQNAHGNCVTNESIAGPSI